MRPFNLLVTAGSRRVPLVQAFRTALRSLGLPGRVIVTDVNPLSPAVHVADRAFRVPMSSDPAYIEEVQEICALEQIRLVVPTIDDELPIYMAGHFYGSGRVFFLASGEMWRLNAVDDTYSQQFYTKLIRWVCEGRLLRDSMISMPRSDATLLALTGVIPTSRMGVNKPTSTALTIMSLRPSASSP